MTHRAVSNPSPIDFNTSEIAGTSCGLPNSACKRFSLHSRVCTAKEMSDDSHARLLSCHTDTNLTFDNAILVQSNLGAQGGRCVTETFRDGWTSNWEDLCRNPQPGVQHGPSASYPYGVFMPQE